MFQRAFLKNMYTITPMDLTGVDLVKEAALFSLHVYGGDSTPPLPTFILKKVISKNDMRKIIKQQDYSKKAELI